MFCSIKVVAPCPTSTKRCFYKITCPDCFNKLIGKTDRNIITRIDEHGTKPDQPMHQHLTNLKNISDFTHFLI